MVAPGIHFGHTFTAVEILAEQHFGVVAVEQICDLARMEFGGSSFLPSGIIVAEIIKIVVLSQKKPGVFRRPTITPLLEPPALIVPEI